MKGLQGYLSHDPVLRMNYFCSVLFFLSTFYVSLPARCPRHPVLISSYELDDVSSSSRVYLSPFLLILLGFAMSPKKHFSSVAPARKSRRTSSAGWATKKETCLWKWIIFSLLSFVLNSEAKFDPPPLPLHSTSRYRRRTKPFANKHGRRFQIRKLLKWLCYRKDSTFFCPSKTRVYSFFFFFFLPH